MNKTQFTICFVVSILYIGLIIYTTINYSGFLSDFFFFILLLSSGIGIYSLIAPMFLNNLKPNEITKEQYFGLMFFPTLGAIIFSFSFYYSNIVYKTNLKYEFLKSNYIEAFYNVQKLIENDESYHPDLFIEAFPNYRDYIEY